MEFSGKHIAVLGFGVEGQPTTAYLIRHGARVEVFDARSAEQFSQTDMDSIERLKDQGVIFHLAEESSMKGFDAIVRTPGMPQSHPWLAEARREGIPVTSGTAIFLNNCPGIVVGVTGTKGKGTTSTLIYEMLIADGKKAELLGNIGVPALSALERITEDTIVVYELSSFQLMEVEKSPHIAVVLMVTQDHLDHHGSIQDYIEAKRNIVRYQNADDRVIANIDYSASRDIGESSQAKKFWVSRRRSVQQGACVSGDEIIFCKDNACETVIKTSEIVLPGAHNLENACAAVMAAVLLGVQKEAMVQVLRTFEGLEHRLHLVGTKNDVRYFDDSISTTPESAIGALEAFEEKKVMFLGGSSKNADFSQLAKIFTESDSLRGVIGLGEEWPRIKEAMLQAHPEPFKFEIREGFESMENAVKAAAELAQPGDVVILSPACASFGMFKSYKDRGEQFIAAVERLGE